MLEVKITSAKTELFFHMMAEKTKSNIKLMQAIAGDMADSTEENFSKQGRPGWDSLKQGTIDKRTEAKQVPIKMLQASTKLVTSIHTKAVENRATIGTNVPYARIHQFGGTIKHPGGTGFTFLDGKIIWMRKKDKSGAVIANRQSYRGVTKPHDIEIPARPYLNLSGDEKQSIKKRITEWYAKP